MLADEKRWLAQILAGVFVLSASVFAQDEPPVQGPPLPGEKPKDQGAAVQRPPRNTTMSRPQVVTYPVQKIEEYREGKVLDIPTHEDRNLIDLTAVDYTADRLISVGGKVLTQADFRRYGVILAGATELDQYVTFLLTREIMDEALKAGTDPKKFEVSEEELLTAVEEKKKLAPQFFQKSPEEWEQAVRDEFGWERYLEVERVNLAFGKVFLPAFVAGMKLPEHTKRYLKPEVVKTIQDYYDKGNDLPFIFKTTFLNQIRAELVKNAKLDYFFESEMANDVVMTVDDRPVKTSEIWGMFSVRLKPNDLELILRDMIVSTATDQALASAGFLMSVDERREAFAAHEAEYEGTILPIQLMVALRGFSSIHRYRDYHGRKIGFTSLLKSQYPGSNWKDRLREHFESGATRLSFHNGRVRSDAIFVAAKDPKTGEMVEGGLSATIAEAKDLSKRCVEDGEHFGALLIEASDLPEAGDQSRGRFGIKSRYELKKLLGETEYTTYLNGGYSLADEVFYTGTESEVIGPVVRTFPADAQGSFLVRVDHFQRRESPETLDEVEAKVEVDFVDIEFQKFCHGAMKSASVEILNEKEGSTDSGEK